MADHTSRIGLDASGYISSVEKATAALNKFARTAEFVDSAQERLEKSTTAIERTLKPTTLALKQQIGAFEQVQEAIARMTESLRMFRRYASEGNRAAAFIDDLNLATKNNIISTIASRKAWAEAGVTLAEYGKNAAKLAQVQEQLSNMSMGEKIANRERRAFEEAKGAIKEKVTAIRQEVMKLEKTNISMVSSAPVQRQKEQLSGQLKELLAINRRLSSEQQKLSQYQAQYDAAVKRTPVFNLAPEEMEVAFKGIPEKKLAEIKAQQAKLGEIEGKIIQSQQRRTELTEQATALETSLAGAVGLYSKKLQQVANSAAQRAVKKEVGGYFEEATKETKIRIYRLQRELKEALGASAGKESVSDILKQFASNDPKVLEQAAHNYKTAYTIWQNLQNEKMKETNRLLEIQRKQLEENAKLTGEVTGKTIGLTQLRRQIQETKGKGTSPFSREELTQRYKLIGNIEHELGQALKEMGVDDPRVAYKLYDQYAKGSAAQAATIEQRFPRLARAIDSLLKDEEAQLQRNIRARDEYTRALLQGEAKVRAKHFELSNKSGYTKDQVGVLRDIKTLDPQEGRAIIRQFENSRNAFLQAFEQQKLRLAEALGKESTDKVRPDAIIQQFKSGDAAVRAEAAEKFKQSWVEYNRLVNLEQQYHAKVNEELARKYQRIKDIDAKQKNIVKLQQEEHRLKELRASGRLDALIGKFEKDTNKSVSGQLRVETIMLTERIAQQYSKSGLAVKDFTKNVDLIREGNTNLIRQFPELTYYINKFDQSIRGATKAGNDLYLHLDNFKRLIFARFLTFAFYNLTRQLQEAFWASVDVYKGIGAIQTISQKAQRDVEEWRDSVSDLSKRYNFLQTDVAEALYQITSNQVAVGQAAIEFADVVAPFAKATKSTLAQSVDLMTAAINSFRINTANAELVAAKLFKTVELGRLRVSDMSAQFGRVANMAELTNIELEDMLAMLTTLTISGVKFERASTFIINVLNKLAKPTEQMKRLFAEWNVTSGQAAIEIYGLSGVFEKLFEATKGQAGELADVFKDIRPIIGSAALLRNQEKVAKDIEQMKNALESFYAAQKLIYEGPGEHFSREMNKIKNYYIEWGANILRVVVGLDRIIEQGITLGNMPLIKKGSHISDLTPLLSYGLFAATGYAVGNMIEAISPKFFAERNLLGVSGSTFLKKIVPAAIFAVGIKQLLQKSIDDISLSTRSNDLLPDTYLSAMEGYTKTLETQYNKQVEAMKNRTAKITAFYEQEKIAYGSVVRDMKDMWEGHIKVLRKSPEHRQGLTKEIGTYFDFRIKKDTERRFTHYDNKGIELLARQEYAQGLLARIDQAFIHGPEQGAEMIRSFMQFGQDTLANYDTMLVEIEKALIQREKAFMTGDTSRLEDAARIIEQLGFDPDYWSDSIYQQLQRDRSHLVGMLDNVVNRMASESGMQLTPDYYENLFRA